MIDHGIERLQEIYDQIKIQTAIGNKKRESGPAERVHFLSERVGSGKFPELLVSEGENIFFEPLQQCVVPKKVKICW
ncbi:hypothetical protein Desac_1196 [Desulfobacca acetoxidans DSM 11109]|uniref:Uncharacterized protein n=1 Tax=Desulfobacca acetoxidans (strain ATCC 700848 / DSM 11109 / ASRB2) TaxID=880072 RepID=F2NHE2_DESAR|nr:hypothetical protein Desac_1196 [Desulfobacca acetoxidans DSM 11109]